MSKNTGQIDKRAAHEAEMARLEALADRAKLFGPSLRQTIAREKLCFERIQNSRDIIGGAPAPNLGTQLGRHAHQVRLRRFKFFGAIPAFGEGDGQQIGEDAALNGALGLDPADFGGQVAQDAGIPIDHVNSPVGLQDRDRGLSRNSGEARGGVNSAVTGDIFAVTPPPESSNEAGGYDE